jgi:hypothetical protein
VGVGAASNGARGGLWATRAAKAYTVVGDAVGVYQSTKSLLEGCFQPTDLLGFAPVAGFAAGRVFRGLSGADDAVRGTNNLISDVSDDVAANIRGTGLSDGSNEFWDKVVKHKLTTYEKLGAQEQEIADRIYDTFRERFIDPGIGEPIHTIRNVRNLGDGLYEIKHKSGVRVYLDKNGNKLGVSNKNNQGQVINKLKSFLGELET